MASESSILGVPVGEHLPKEGNAEQPIGETPATRLIQTAALGFSNVPAAHEPNHPYME